MEKIYKILINIFDPPTLQEIRMERRWKARLQKIQNKTNRINKINFAK